jgi:hypothetical protein
VEQRLILRIVQFHLTVHPNFFSLSLSFTFAWPVNKRNVLSMYTAAVRSPKPVLSWGLYLLPLNLSPCCEARGAPGVATSAPFNHLAAPDPEQVTALRPPLIYNSTAARNKATQEVRSPTCSCLRRLNLFQSNSRTHNAGLKSNSA